MRVWIVLTCVLIATLPAPGGETCTSADRNAWVLAIVKEAETIKVGMTRASLTKVYVEEGGTAQRTHRTYAFHGCPYIKVDVEFAPISKEQDLSTEMPDDKIVKISRPYLDYAVID